LATARRNRNIIIYVASCSSLEPRINWRPEK
jgi:hypothetical protein